MAAAAKETKIQNRRTGKFKCKGSYGWNDVGYAWSPANINKHIGMMKSSGNWEYDPKTGKRVMREPSYYRDDDDDIDVVEYELVEVTRTPIKEVMEQMKRKKLGKYDLENAK